jgi:hypothetical protein
MTSDKNQNKQDKQVERILDGLTGDLRQGQRYYLFTVTYAYIGRVERVTERTVTLEANSIIVSRAGDEDDAVSKIVAGKKDPANFERCPSPITIYLQSLTTVIPMQKN